MPADEAGAVVGVGRIGRPYGVRGWVHVHSGMAPPEALLEHSAWLLGRPVPLPRWREHRVCDARVHGQALVARVEGCESREDAERLRGWAIGLERAVLPELEDDEYYWVDLIGAAVIGPGGERYGEVKGFLETGTHDVMVVTGERERLIPFMLHRTVTEVDLAERRVVVDWDPDF